MAGAARRSTKISGKRLGRAADPRLGGAEPDAVFAAAFQAGDVPLLLAEAGLADQPIQFANAAFCRLTGYGPEEVVGRDLQVLQGPGTDHVALARLRAALARGDAASAEILAYRKDGTAVPVAVRLSPVRMASGGRYAVAVVEELETGRAALQAALDRATARLHEVDHRAKNTLQVIASLVLLKARRTEDPTCRTALDRVAERVGALAAVQRLLQEGEDAGHFDLRAFAADLADELAAELDPGRIALSVEVEPVAVAADKAAPLALLVHELATNAVRHAFPDGRPGRVRIAAGRREDRLVLSVEDDGVGLDATGAPPDALGLAVVAMMTRQLAGTLTWDRTPPGTRAEVSLPWTRPIAG
ncbi:sensor histidine kinase [Methylobacterium oryzisoli]|uniref:sensor histidine kinase n=1 Tax=Methylobacterium oryzisoli TaxID=3385502 RepID=UPI003892358A